MHNKPGRIGYWKAARKAILFGGMIEVSVLGVEIK